MNIATYQVTPEKHGNGTFFFTDCGHNMYSVRDNMAYHGCLWLMSRTPVTLVMEWIDVQSKIKREVYIRKWGEVSGKGL